MRGPVAAKNSPRFFRTRSNPRRSYLLETLKCVTSTMNELPADTTHERCLNDRCWVGPVLVVETKGGAVGDLCQWIRIMLSHHYSKADTLGLMDCLEFNHIHEEHAIMAFASGREPMGSTIREVYSRVMVDHDGVLRSNCAAYRFSIIGEGEQERCDALIAHYDWIGRVAQRRKVLHGTTD